MANGKPSNLPYHQARMERTIRHFFPNLALNAMPSLQNLITPNENMSLVKARVVYGADGVELIEYAPYSMRPIRSLQVVYDDTISYSYKSCDRSQLNALAAKKGDCDEIIIVKNNLLTDTSFTNIAIFDGNYWLTPRQPLLLGTRRASLLDQGFIKEADITVDDLKRAERIRLFNAMIDFGEREVEAKNISFLR